MSAPGAARSLLIYLPELKLGGAEISLLRLAQGLAERGLRVAFAVHRADPAACALAGGIELVSLQAGRTLAAARRLADVLRARRPDLLLSALTHANVVAVLAARWARSGTRVVVSEHAPASSMQALDRSRTYRATLALMPWAYRGADAVVAVSQGVRDDFAARLPQACRERLEVIANPVLRRDWRELAQAPVDEPWFEPGQPPVVLSVGRLSPEKDFAGLIRAFAALEPQAGAAPARLVIVGEGPQRAELQALIDALGLSARAHLPGSRGNPYAYMQRARVFALASRFEGFGNVLIEAMACGAPVVSTDCPVGPREILEHGRYGRLVPVADEAALAAAIGRSLHQPGSTAAAAAHAQRFTVERSAAQYLALFQRVLAPV